MCTYSLDKNYFQHIVMITKDYGHGFYEFSVFA